MLNDIDTKSIDNITQKLQIHMQRNNQTMHGLASSMGFDYQPFYRLMTKKSLPTISSLNHIAEKLNCSISELLADHIFLDVPGFTSIENFLANKSSTSIRIYITTDMLRDMDECIAIKTDIPDENHQLNNIDFHLNTNVYQLFTVTSKINIDGFFLVKYRKQITMLEVVSISSKVIMAIVDGKIVQIPTEDLEAYVKFITYIELPNPLQNTVSGKLI